MVRTKIVHTSGIFWDFFEKISKNHFRPCAHIDRRRRFSTKGGGSESGENGPAEEKGENVQTQKNVTTHPPNPTKIT